MPTFSTPPHPELYRDVYLLSLSRTDFRCVWLFMASFHRTQVGCIGQPSSVPGLAALLSVLSLYADDTSVVVASERAIETVFSVYASFKRGSGSRLNLGKCEGLWLGSWRGRPDAPVPISWTSAHIKVLGVYIGHGDLETANCRPRLDSVKRCLDAWHGRTLSFQGKAVAFNA